MADNQAEIIKKIKCYLKKVSQNGFKIKQAYLYGSYARGKQRKNSDIDVAIVSPAFSADFVTNYVVLARLRKNIDIRIEPKAFLPEEFVDEHPLVWEIKQYGILLK